MFDTQLEYKYTFAFTTCQCTARRKTVDKGQKRNKNGPKNLVVIMSVTHKHSVQHKKWPSVKLNT